MIKILNYLLRWFYIDLVAVHIPPGLAASAKVILAQTEIMSGSGEFKRAQALRALMNRHPEVRERDCALIIELVLCGAA